MTEQHYHSTGEVCSDPLCQPGVRVLQPKDLTKNHEFLRIWTDDQGNFKSDLNCPPEANAGFGDRTNMEILHKHLIRVSVFVNEVLGFLSAALSESYLAQVQEALEKGNVHGQQEEEVRSKVETGGEASTGREATRGAREDLGDRNPRSGS